MATSVHRPEGIEQGERPGRRWRLPARAAAAAVAAAASAAAAVAAAASAAAAAAAAAAAVAAGICLASGAAASVVPDSAFVAALDGRVGGLVLVDVQSGSVSRHNPQVCGLPLPPCSTFKIWNTLIGLTEGEAGEPFYTWDGVERPIADWNRDLDLRDAFRVSCVPAFQALARRIGAARMRSWIDTLQYGDRDLSAGLDQFWLPAPGRKTLLITSDQQAELVRRLVTGELPFPATALATLKEAMQVRLTAAGALYGKTGSSGALPSGESVGWFVGYLERPGATLVFACVLQGEGASGKQARALIEGLFTSQGLL